MASEDLTGRTLGDFVVRHRLGEGGYGAVYRAEQVTLGREAVIKVLHARHRASKTSIQRFLREARLASKLDHPYAAHIYAFNVESDGLMWIAMELVRGQTLHELLRARGALPLEELVPLLDGICEVLQTAHDLGIVHRDIKPPNVMVVQRSGRAFPKLLDFGIAKASVDDLGERTPTPTPTPTPSRTPVPTPTITSTPPDGASGPPTIAQGDDATLSFVGQPGGALGAVMAKKRGPDTAASSPTIIAVANTQAAPSPSNGSAHRTPDSADDPPLTEAGAAIGSPPYMAPEVWSDAAEATLRTDLYALGILAYEALTGRRPFIGATPTALAIAHLTLPVPPLGDAYPAALDAVLRKVLAKDPKDRFASALELAQAFRTAAGFGSVPVPSLDDELRLSVEASFPQPIAEAVAAFHAARNPHQGRDALRDIATAAIRYVALVALAARAQVQLADAGTATAIADTVRDLRRRPLTDEEWLRLARALVEPFRDRPQAHPIPELVAVLAPGDSDPLGDVANARAGDPEPLAAIRELLPPITRLLRALAFLGDYPLVVLAPGAASAEAWMGVRRPRRVALEVRGRAIDANQPVLLDAAGRPSVVLAPLVQTSQPMPGAPAELFVLDGGGRRGARMVALPNTLERQDETVWDWLAERFSSHDRDTPVSPDSLESRPFRGLAAFTAQDADTFVGREREIDAAINRLNTSALIAVVGPSGAGKSSFVHAGVLPSLPKSSLIISVRPGASPVATLEQRLRRAGIAVEIAADPAALGNALDARDTTTVLVIDQFEELFTLGASLDEQRAYVRALLAAAQSAEDHVRVVLTLRDDFLGRALQLGELRDRLPASLFLLGTPARADLVRILTEPLAKKGFDFEDPALPQRMVDEVAETPGALALLSFTAARLWELRDRHFRQLTKKAYDALGGVVGALGHHAETTLSGLSPHEQQLVRTILGHLVTAEGTRASLTRSELAQLTRDDAADGVVEKLVAARLLVTTESERGEDRVELIHEALVVAWPRLAEWRRDNAEGVRLRDQVRAAARQWAERERARGLLWRDDALAELTVWRARHPQPLTDTEEAFVRASIAEATRGRRVRRGVIGVVIGLMAVAVAVLLWARSNLQATAARDRERVRTELVESARRNVLDGKFAQAREALGELRRIGFDETPSLRFLEAMALRPIQGITATLRGHGAVVQHVELAPDGTRALTTSADGSARLWDAAAGQEVSRFAGCAIAAASFDPTGRRIAVDCSDGIVRILDRNGSRERELALARPRATPSQAAHSRWTADGNRLVTSLRGAVEMWDVATGRRLWAAATSVPQARVAIAPGGKIIASLAAIEPEATLWDAETGAALRTFKLAPTRWEPIYEEPSALAFDATGTRMFTVARRTEVVQIWDLERGELAGTIEPRAGLIWSLQITRTGRAVIATRNAIQIWAIAKATLETTLAIGTNHVLDLASSVDDTLLGATMNDGLVTIWNLAAGTQVAALQGHAGAARTLAFDRTGERVITGGADATAIVWDLRAAAATKIIATDTTANRLDIRGDRMLVATEQASVWSLADGKLLAQRPIGPNADARFVDDDDIAIVDRQGVLALWNTSTSTARELARHGKPGDWVEIGDGGRIASWAGPEVIVADRSERFRWTAPSDIVTLAFVPNRGSLAIADARGTIHLLGATGALERAWPATRSPNEPVWRLLALADGRLIAMSSYVVRVWSSTGALVAELAHPNAPVTTTAIDRAATRLATAGEDGLVRIWDLASYQLAQTLPHTWFVRKVAFSRDDQLLAALDDEGVVHVWNPASGELLYRFASQRGLLDFADSAIVTTGKGAIVLFPTR